MTNVQNYARREESILFALLSIDSFGHNPDYQHR